MLSNLAIAKLNAARTLEVTQMQQTGQAAAGIGGAIVDIILG